ncbi:MAG: MerR family transcriptional regulator [Pseudomonadota bacterium]
MKIGELCSRSGVSKDTIRHYEALGLLRPSYRPAGNRHYRHYGEDTLQRLAHIANGKRAGFSLREIRAQLDQLMDGRMDSAKQRATLLAQLARIDEQIATLREAKQFLRTQLARVDRFAARQRQP